MVMIWVCTFVTSRVFLFQLLNEAHWAEFYQIGPYDPKTKKGLFFYFNTACPMYTFDYGKMALELFPKLLHHHMTGIVLTTDREMV